VPRRTTELRVTGLEESATPEEFMPVVAEAGGCRADEASVGDIRSTSRSLGSVWLRCPLTAARKISGGKINIG
jgi:hypothetical protein